MAIKVQVKESSTSKVQPNFFNNAATMGINSAEFIGLDGTCCMDGSTSWNMPAATTWTTPITGFNAMNTFNTIPAFANTTSLPYARQNAFLGQLPGMWQGEMISPIAPNPYFSSMNTQAPVFANGINTGFGYINNAGMPIVPSFRSSTPAATWGLNTVNPAMTAAQIGMGSQSVIAHLPIDVLDNGSQYLLVADLPGVKIDDLELTLENGLLMIKAVSQATAFVPGVDVTTPVATISREKAPIKIYQRAFAIGRDVTVENITASLSNGVLTISMPKANVVTGTPSRIRNTVVAA